MRYNLEASPFGISPPFGIRIFYSNNGTSKPTILTSHINGFYPLESNIIFNNNNKALQDQSLIPLLWSLFTFKPHFEPHPDAITIF